MYGELLVRAQHSMALILANTMLIGKDLSLHDPAAGVFEKAIRQPRPPEQPLLPMRGSQGSVTVETDSGGRVR